MYNPYGWKIVKKEQSCDEFYRDLTKIQPTDCILNELGRICTQIYFKKEQYKKLKDEAHDVEKEILELEKKKVDIINKIYEE